MANTQRRVPVRLEGNCAGMLDMLYQVAQQPRAYWHPSLVSFCLGVAPGGTEGVADTEFTYELSRLLSRLLLWTRCCQSSSCGGV